MTEIAHAAIDAGADVVIGHGPHYSLPVEIYKGKPIFYGLGSFSFHTGHGGRKHGNWVGMLARVTLEERGVERASFQFVRHNERNETVLCAMRDEGETLEKLGKRSAALRDADRSRRRRGRPTDARMKDEGGRRKHGLVLTCKLREHPSSLIPHPSSFILHPCSGDSHCLTSPSSVSTPFTSSFSAFQ